MYKFMPDDQQWFQSGNQQVWHSHYGVKHTVTLHFTEKNHSIHDQWKQPSKRAWRVVIEHSIEPLAGVILIQCILLAKSLLWLKFAGERILHFYPTFTVSPSSLPMFHLLIRAGLLEVPTSKWAESTTAHTHPYSVIGFNWQNCLSEEVRMASILLAFHKLWKNELVKRAFLHRQLCLYFIKLLS